MQPYSRFIGLLAVMAAMSAHGEIPVSDALLAAALPYAPRNPNTNPIQ